MKKKLLALTMAITVAFSNSAVLYAAEEVPSEETEVISEETTEEVTEETAEEVTEETEPVEVETENLKKVETPEYGSRKLTTFKSGNDSITSANEKEIVITTDSADAFYYLEMKNTSEYDGLNYVLYTDKGHTEIAREEIHDYEVAWGINNKGTAEYKLGKLEPNKSYYLVFSTNSANAITYTYTVTRAVDDKADDISKATKATIGKTASGTIEDERDYEYFSFTADNTDSFYYLTMKNIAASGAVGYVLYSDYDCTEIVREEIYDYEVEGRVSAKDTVNHKLGKLKPGKTYYLKFYGLEDAGVDYNFTVTKVNDDHKDDIKYATKAKIGTTVKGKIEDEKDYEYYSFTADKTDSFYYLTMKNIAASGAVGYVLYSDYNCTEKVREEIYDYEVEGRVSAKDTVEYKLGKLKPGKTYYLKFYGMDEAGINYNFTVTKINDDYKDDIRNATSVSINKSKTGKMQDEKDYEYFKFTTDGSKNSYYYVEIVNTSSKSKLNYTLYTDYAQTNIAKEKNQGYDSDMNWGINAKDTIYDCIGKISGKKTYYLKLSTTEAGITYKVKFIKSTDKINAKGSSATTLALNAGKTYRIQNYTDKDCFKFKTTSLATHTLSVKNINGNDDIRVRVFKKSSCSDKYCVYDAQIAKGKTLNINKIADNVKFSKKATYYVTLESGNYADYKITVKANAPSGFSAKAIGSKKVKLSWKKDSSAKGYYVYRATSKTGKYKKVATIRNNKTVTYTNKKLTKGKKYYYYVVSYDTNKKVSDKTAIKAVKVK